MTAWSEENFLERLTPRLRKGAESTAGPCPDSESLSAFAENQGSNALREAIATHLVSCSNCREIEERLRYFARAEEPEEGLEWKNAEKRLDNWMAAFLSAPVSRDQAGRAYSVGSVGQPTKSTGWMSSWRLVWALGTLAIVAVVASTTFFLGFRLGRTQQRQVVAQVAPPTAQPAITRTTETKPKSATESTAVAPPPGRAPAEEEGARRPALAYGPSREQPTVSSGRASSPSTSAPLTEALAVPRVNPEGGGRTQTPSREVPTNASPEASVVASAPPRSSAGVRTEGTPVPVEGLASLTRSASTRLPAAPALRPAATELVNYPASIHLPSGTRVWIQIKAVNRRADGSFTFQGSLHLPVTRAKRVLLERGAEVNGVGSESHGQTSLSIRELVVHSARYVLKSAPASEGAVPFEGGRVLETFISSDSIYEKTGDTTGQPQPQK